MFIVQVLQKNIQCMIFIFKRVIINDLEHFLQWFKDEVTDNERFREIYLEVCTQKMQYLISQWKLVNLLQNRAGKSDGRG